MEEQNLEVDTDEFQDITEDKNFGTTLLFVIDSFFGVVLFVLFLLPIMKIDFMGNEFAPYNLYKFIEVFSKGAVEWSNEIKTILGCCYAALVVACICILISIYSIAKAVTNKKINKHNIMILMFITLAIIAIVMMVNINSIDNLIKIKINKFNEDIYGNLIVGGKNEPLKDIYKVGALPIVLLVVSIILFIVHFFDFIASCDSSD